MSEHPISCRSGVSMRMYLTVTLGVLALVAVPLVALATPIHCGTQIEYGRDQSLTAMMTDAVLALVRSLHIPGL